MDGHRITAFPTLCSVYQDSQTYQYESETIVYDAADISHELLLVSWGKLLNAYTGHERVSFYVGSSVVSVSFESVDKHTISYPDDVLEAPSRSISTGVSFHQPLEQSSLSLWLLHNNESGRGTLRSKGATPSGHLLELGCQLRSILQAQHLQDTEQTLFDIAATPRLSILNPQPHRFDTPKYLHQIFGERVFSDDVAIRYLSHELAEEQVTYRQLLERAHRLALSVQEALKAQGQSEKQAIVPILAPQSPDLYIGELAVSFAGAAFCPLALDAPEERIRYICQDTDAAVILTTKACASELPSLDQVVVYIDGDMLLPWDGRNPTPLDKDHPLSYIMYTSGSTGAPKGVKVSHTAILQALAAHENQIRHFSRFLQFAAPTFDVSIFEIYFTFSRGATLICCDRQLLLSNLPLIINRMQIDAAELTPTVAGSLLRTREACPNLKILLTIGEMLTSAVIEEFGDSVKRKGILHAMYGPTENIVHCTMQTHLASNSITGQIGRPLSTVSAYIIGPHLSTQEVLPVGMMGELAIGGFQMADGYMNRPDETERAFVHSPVYGLLYRTGDKARLLPDGTLECVGRISESQVKLRGQRVELGEVEAVVMQKAQVQLAVALIINDSLILFVTHGHQKIFPTHVMDVCRASLPPIMVPSDVFVLDSIPRLQSGKVDRKSLQDSYGRERNADTGPGSEAQDPLERRLCDLFGEVIADRPSPLETLARRDIDSLKAIRVASIFNQNGFNVSAPDVLGAGCIRNLADRVREIQSLNSDRAEEIDKEYSSLNESLTQAVQTSQNIKWEDVEKVTPCSHVQLAMLAETSKNPRAYCNSITFKLSASPFQASSILRMLAEQTPMFRSGFIPTDDSRSPFATIIWKELPMSQIKTVSRLKDRFELLDPSAFLRPISAQIMESGDECVILLQLHHALYDGWSWDIITKDMVGILHNDHVIKKPPYDAYVKAMFQHLRSNASTASESFWKQTLSNFHPSTLPVLTKNEMRSTNVGKRKRTFSADLDALAEVARKCHAHPQACLLAVFSILLSSYTATADVIIDVVNAGRALPLAGIENIIGPCIETLPLRLDVCSDLSVSRLVERTQERLLEMFRHGSLPLSKIKAVADLAPDVPLSDVLFVWQESAVSKYIAENYVQQLSTRDHVEHTLLLEVEPITNLLEVSATFKGNVISQVHVEEILSQMDSLCSFIVSDESPNTIRDLAQSIPEQHLSVSHSPPLTYTFDSLHSPVEEWAEKDPERDALEYIGLSKEGHSTKRTLSYKVLNHDANLMFAQLQQLGVQRGDNVCCLIDKCLSLYVAILAISKLGAAFLSITPETPDDRVSAMLQKTKPRVCIVDTGTALQTKSFLTSQVLNVDQPDFQFFNPAKSSESFMPNETAYVVFTSGTTGTPKGIAISQESLASNIHALEKLYPARRDSSNSELRYLQSCSQAFDVSVFDIFYAWHMGMCLVFAQKNLLYRNIEGFVRDHHITHLSMTPTVAALINPEVVPEVQMLVTSGEAVTESIIRSWRNRLFVGYGPAETTNICTVQTYLSHDQRTALVGPPLQGTSAFVLEANASSCNVMPKGAVGELCFSGQQVFKGYINDDEQTRAKIINHPYFGRIYRSGDIGAMLTDGSLMCFGRFDNQVKIRGQRVELGEIDTVLFASSNVKQAVTIAIKDDRARTEYLVAMWVPTVTDDLTDARVINADALLQDNINQLFALVLSKLPDYMCPRTLIPVTRIPMTANDKIDTRTLSRMAQELSASNLNLMSRHAEGSASSETSPTSDLENTIFRVLCELTGIKQCDINRFSSFYRYGIDSVIGIALASRLRTELSDPQIDVGQILQYPSVATLAKHLEDSTLRSQHNEGPPLIIEKRLYDSLSQQAAEYFGSIDDVLPCTALQDAFLSASMRSLAGAYYNTMVFTIESDTVQLKQAWQVLMSRQAILRTRFMTTKSKDVPFVQVILSHATLPWEGQDARDNQKRNNVVNSIEAPWNLQLFDTSKKLRLSMHHALYDGIAMFNLLHEVESIFKSESLLPPIPFRPFIEHIHSNKVEDTANYWGSYLQDVEPTVFPNLTGKSPNAQKYLTGYNISHRVVPIPLSSINSSCQQNAITLLSICQAAWGTLLHTYLGTPDICFGNVVSGRSLPVEGVDRLIAPCFNTIPIRIKFAEHLTRQDTIKNLMQTNATHLSFQMTPLRHIQSLANLEGQHLFDTLLILQQASKPLDDSIWKLESDEGDMDFPLAIELTPLPQTDTLEISLHYERSVLLDHDTHVVIDLFIELLSIYLERPITPKPSISSTSDIETRSKPLVNTTRRDIPPPNTKALHSAFEDNVIQHPSNLALDFLRPDGSIERWTYLDLSEKANGIAHALQDEAVQLQEAVIIHLPKSPLFYACVLAVLKSGATFTPFDPDAPNDRKAIMESDLKPNVVLATEAAQLSWSNCKLIDVSTIASQATFNSDRKARASNLAYRLYTSGSTGRPKGVSVEHGNAVHAIEESRSVLPLDLSSRLLQYASSSFDMCYYDCFLAWSSGSCLCAASQSTMFNNLIMAINRLGATFLDLTPSVASLVKPAQVPTVELLYCIGEAMPQQFVEDWSERCLNSYGPTEAAMCVTICFTNPSMSSAVIGAPFNSTTFKVVGTNGEELPTFGLGELHIGGAQVARNYHGDDELTHKYFYTAEGQRFYKSGDLVRRLANGCFEFVGRNTDQVKIRGLRVELGEITSVVCSGDSRIVSASTRILRLSSAAPQLVTFIVLQPRMYENQIIENAKLQCSRKLPAYMIPTSFVVVDRIPLSSAGKVDKKRLLEIFRQQTSTTSSGEGKEQLNDNENVVAAVLASIAGCDVNEVRPGTTIYQLGLDSISAVQVAIELQDQGLRVEPTDVIQHPTVSGIASAVRSIEQNGDTDNIESTPDLQHFQASYLEDACRDAHIRRTCVAKIRPCTPFQTGSVARFMHSRGKDYLNHLVIKLKTPQVLSDIGEAFDVLIEKYEMLRTGFVPIDNKAYPFAMIVHRARSVTSPIVTGPASDVEEWQKSVKHRCLNDLHEPAWAALIDETERCSIHVMMHHALYDAASLQMILHDLHTVLDGSMVIFPEPNVDAAIWNIVAKGNNLREAECFWKHLRGQAVSSILPDLAPLRINNPVQLSSHLVSSSTLSSLEASCRLRNSSLPTVAQAAWTRLLATYTNEKMVCFGNVLSGRLTEASIRVAFPCITTVPVFADATKEDDELLHDLMDFNRKLLPYQFVPLNKVQQWLGLDDVAPFQTLFAFQKHKGEQDSLGFDLIDSEANVEYPMSIEVEPSSGNRLVLRLTFINSSVPQEQADVILKQLDAFIHDILRVEKRGSIALEKDLVSISPPKFTRLESTACLLHQLFEQTAEAFPDKTAFEFVNAITKDSISKRTWSYRDLDVAGNKVANFLIGKAFGPCKLVAICFSKCQEASFAMLGILKAGNGFVAIDPEAPVARTSYIVNDSEPTAMLTTSDLKSSFGDSIACPIFAIDSIDLTDTSGLRPALDYQIQPSDTSYCLYTSGSTGKPKGCNLSHDNAVQAMMAFQRLFKWKEDDRWLQFAGYHFDVSILEHFWTWSVGLTMVGIPREILFEDLGPMIGRLAITHVDLTPALAQTVDPRDIPTLCTDHSVFITGGETLRDDIIVRWGEYGTLYNGYGPTEATIGCTMYPRIPSTSKAFNIGWQFDNVGALVLKPKTRIPVLRGAPGELCVYGPLVAKGYLNRPERNAESFEHIEINGKVERMYRTGDLVRLLHDESFAFAGRADDQIKIRGQRIETREINTVIRGSDEKVKHVVTLKLKHPQQQKEQLVAFFSRKESEAKDPTACILLEDAKQQVQMALHACRRYLPGFAVPTHFIAMTALPLSANNKIDRKVLKTLFHNMSFPKLQALATGADESSTPLTQREKRVAEIVSELTGFNGADVQGSTSIFEMGLDSVSVLGLVRALKRNGIRKAQPSVVMGNGTIRSLCATLFDINEAIDDNGVRAAMQNISACGQRYRNTAARSLKVEYSDIESIAPCTPLQQGMISRALGSDAPVYFTDFRLHLRQDVDTSRIQDAWKRVVANTSMLRTLFVNTDSGHVQIALKGYTPPWIEVKCAPKVSVEHLLDQRYHEWWLSNRQSLAVPLELIICKQPNAHVLVLHIFHALYDGISLPLLLNAVTDAYRSGVSNAGPSFQHVLAYGPLKIAEGARPFWLSHLRGLRYCRKIQPMITRARKADSLVERRLDIRDGIDKTRKRLNTTHQALVQVAWLATLAQYFGPVCVGVVVSGRQIDCEGAEQAIGPLFNTIPMNIQISGNMSWSSIVSKCHAFNTSGLPYQHTALRDIQKWARKEGLILTSQNLFDNLLVFRSADEQDAGLDPLWDSIDSAAINADYPLAMEVEHSPGGFWVATVSAQASYAGDKELHDLIRTFEIALNALVENAEEAVSRALHVSEDAKNALSARDSGDTTAKATDDYKTGGNDFHWTPSARCIQEEIAALSGLRTEDITPNASILELGLDSVDAIKLSSVLKRRVGTNISQKQIMRSLTITNMCDLFLQSNQATTDQPSNLSVLQGRSQAIRQSLEKQGVSPRKFENVLPATPLQEAMVAEMQATDFRSYFNHDVLEIAPDIDIDRLKEAWRKVIDANAILRTSFHEIEEPAVESSFAQLVHPQQSIVFGTKKGGMSELGEIMEAVRQDVQAAHGDVPPLRLTFIGASHAKRPSHLVFSIAHALYDGWSINLLHKDVQAAYHGNLPPRQDVEPLLEEILSSDVDVEARQFWQDTVDGLSPTLILNNDLGRPASFYRAEHRSRLPALELRAFCRTHHVSLSALTQTVYTFGLADLAKQTDVAFGLVLSGRDSQETQEIMFPTMNTVVFRSVLHGTRAGMVQYVQDSMNEIRRYDRYPLRKALNAIQKGMETSRLFDTLFLFQGSPAEALQDPTRKFYNSVSGNSQTEYPLATEAEVVTDSLMWRTACRDDVFNALEVESFLCKLDQILESIVESPDSQCIAFSGSSVSVCELPVFQPRQVQSPPQVDTEPRPGSHDDDYNPDILSLIRSVLAHVAQIDEDNISDSTTLFNLGLDSISAIRVQSTLRKHNVQLTVKDMLGAGSVTRMAAIAHKIDDAISETSSKVIGLPEAASINAKVSEKVDVTALSSQVGVSVDEVELILPATAGQTYMLVTHSKAGVFHPTFDYSMSLQEGMSHELGLDRLTQAWNRLVVTTPILRSLFVATKKTQVPFLQLILTPDSAAAYSFNHLSKKISNMDDYVVIGTCTPFVRLSAAKAPSDGCIGLRLHVHHALYDGVSLPLILRRLELLMQNPSAVLRPTAEQQSNTMLVYATSSLTDDAIAEQRSFYTSYLQDGQRSEAARSKSNIPSQSKRRRVEIFDPSILSAAETAALANMARRENVPLQLLFVACYAQVFSSLMSIPGDGQITIGIYLANRSLTLPNFELSEMPMPTLNIVPLRTKSSNGKSSLVEAAKCAQQDIQNISTEISRATVSLSEVYEMTDGKAKVDTFLNFLTLPGASDGLKTGATRRQHPFRITDADNVRTTTSYARVVDAPQPPSPDEPTGIRGVPEHVANAFGEVLDVEATVTGNGELAMGLFCNQSVYELEALRGAMTAMRKGLLAFLDAARDRDQ